jgi:integrase
MRMGELQGLQIECVQDDYVQVLWSWSQRYVLKRPKRDNMREIPVPGKVTVRLQELIGFNPWGEVTDFVFFSSKREVPVGEKGGTGHFYQALESIGINDKLRRERRQSFHSHRYWFNGALRNWVADTKLQGLTGYRSEAMSDRYQVLSRYDLEDVRRITGIFSPS